MTNIELSAVHLKDDSNAYKKVCPFPVGFIYMSLESVSPATLYGGTWEQISDTKFWLPYDTNPGAVGGSNTISVSQLPAHTHTGPSHSHSFSINSGLMGYVDGSSVSRHKLLGAGNSSGYYTLSSPKVNDIVYIVGNNRSTSAAGTGNTGSTGSGASHWPPHRNCYCWVRKA